MFLFGGARNETPDGCACRFIRDRRDARRRLPPNRTKGTASRRFLRMPIWSNKPSALVDSCYDASLSRITNPSQCAQMFPYYKDPRIVAGAPATDDVFKCALKPVDAADYNPPLSAAQLASVRSVFPSGVCNWKAAGRQGTSRRHVVGVSGPWDVHIASIAGDRMTLRR